MIGKGIIMSPNDVKILIVDDDEAVSKLIETVLTKEGYQVFVANDGSSGVKKADEVHPNLIFMDITMPEMDGYEATSEIKANEELKDIPVIYLSGRSADEDGGKSFATGGASYLMKPFMPQQIRDIVRLALGVE